MPERITVQDGVEYLRADIHAAAIKALLDERDELRKAASWEADHQRRHLEALGLADEFPFGCDAIQHVAEALIALRARLAALEAALPKTADPEPVSITPGMKAWVDVHPMFSVFEPVTVVRINLSTTEMPGMVIRFNSGAWRDCGPIVLFHRHPATGLTVDESESTK